MRKGLWSPDEDERLVRCITKYVNGSWSDIARKAGLDRCGKSCRRRWMNHLRPELKRGKFSADEIDLIIRLQESLGNRWSDIAGHLEGRTDNDVKNLWNTQIKKRLNLQLLQLNPHPAPQYTSTSADRASSGEGEGGSGSVRYNTSSPYTAAAAVTNYAPHWPPPPSGLTDSYKSPSTQMNTDHPPSPADTDQRHHHRVEEKALSVVKTTDQEIGTASNYSGSCLFSCSITDMSMVDNSVSDQHNIMSIAGGTDQAGDNYPILGDSGASANSSNISCYQSRRTRRRSTSNSSINSNSNSNSNSNCNSNCHSSGKVHIKINTIPNATRYHHNSLLEHQLESTPQNGTHTTAAAGPRSYHYDHHQCSIIRARDLENRSAAADHDHDHGMITCNNTDYYQEEPLVGLDGHQPASSLNNITNILSDINPWPLTGPEKSFEYYSCSNNNYITTPDHPQLGHPGDAYADADDVHGDAALHHIQDLIPIIRSSSSCSNIVDNVDAGVKNHNGDHILSMINQDYMLHPLNGEAIINQGRLFNSYNIHSDYAQFNSHNHGKSVNRNHMMTSITTLHSDEHDHCHHQSDTHPNRQIMTCSCSGGHYHHDDALSPKPYGRPTHHDHEASLNPNHNHRIHSHTKLIINPPPPSPHHHANTTILNANDSHTHHLLVHPTNPCFPAQHEGNPRHSSNDHQQSSSTHAANQLIQSQASHFHDMIAARPTHSSSLMLQGNVNQYDMVNANRSNNAGDCGINGGPRDSYTDQHHHHQQQRPVQSHALNPSRNRHHHHFQVVHISHGVPNHRQIESRR